ncbi:histidine phosphatase family protein [Microbacterium sp. C7(2022)]|uniref:histidine phosphatase family protein n=1 Tax=Microbacterium sp. C7(2022) TaxID=2992759 RepID=UPI00237BE689|nr:histidine phosphatase family protein [Microbacterium sp. C7(2022)]MDE0546852.1 histidine phosphatase family protein [Microbacterium sp. C7(2022)]
MTALTLIRHGETDWNLDQRIQGSTDIPLNDTGRAQAREAANLLRTRAETEHLVVVSSDLSRARETAEIIARELALEAPRQYAGLRERSYGEAEGVRTSEFAERWGDWHRAEVPGAEPWPALRRRALQALGAAVTDLRRQTAPRQASLIVVTHGALIREVMRHASAGAFPPVGQRLANGSAHEFLFEKSSLRLTQPSKPEPARV